MQELWERQTHDVPILLRCMADNFARFRPLERNAYTRLLDHLGARGAVQGTYFASLNYDCLFEYAARHYDFTIDYFASAPTTESTLTCWKVHGSCNFIPTDVSGQPSAVSFSASSVIFDSGIVPIDAAKVGGFVVKNAFYPAMAVYMEGKPLHSCPSAIRQLQSLWSEAVLAAEAVGLIGVRPNPSDDHIWEPLAKTKARIDVIGNADDYRNWAGSHPSSKRTNIIGDRFARDLSAFADAFSGKKLE